MSETTNGTIRRAPASTWQRIQRLANTINHLLIGLIGIFITLLGRSHNFQDTAMHAFMTTIGFHVLVAEALMAHYPINPLTHGFSHRTKSKIHGILQLVGGSVALLGSFGKISSTEVHFTTLHGKIGAAAGCMCFASILGGLVNYFQPKFALKVYPPAELKYRHNLFGMVTFTLAMSAIFLGYRTQFFDKFVDPNAVPPLSAATILVYLLTMYGPFKSLLDKRKYRNRNNRA